MTDTPCPHRRAVLAALPGIVVLPGILSACGAQQQAQTTSTEQSSTTVPPTTIPVSEVPVGSAKQVDAGGTRVIVAQPEKGRFVGYSAKCTHKGGTVQVVDGLTLRCPLHGAQYDAATGAVTGPPAPRALDTIPVSAKGNEIHLG